MKGLFFSILFCLAYTVSLAQSISGTVKEATTSELLPGAHIRLLDQYKAANTDENGYYRLSSVREGEYQLIASFIGYESDTATVIITGNEDVSVDFTLVSKSVMTDEFVVIATRAGEEAPFAFTDVSEEEIEDQNLGQDLPMLVNWTPSMVTTSDAGAGVGYTGMRIRGSDATRINVTVNGIPINDAESQGTFWVNMPDFASSTENIQIQRGVGTSSNGAASFGGSVNLRTNTLRPKAYGEAANSFGSFNTRKHTVSVGTGLIDNKWAFDGRLSQVKSDGYIDRAFSDLKSYYLSGGYHGDKTVIKAITFSGKERTYQSWYGTPESRLENDVEAMNTHADNEGYTQEQRENLLTSGRTYNFYLYEGETDNYQQDHYQLHFSHRFSEQFNANAALHYTYGRGYYEQYRQDEDFEAYGLTPLYVGGDTIASTDLIRRRWLDNDFYGATFSLNQGKGKFRNTFGGAYNEYRGDHFGEIIWARYAGNSEIRDRFYDNDAVKTDFNVYFKTIYVLSSRWSFYADMQYRKVTYDTEGFDIDRRDITGSHVFDFFNPKAGLTFDLTDEDQLYASVAVGNREPVRNDFIDVPEGNEPEHESMYDYEAGYRRKAGNYFFNTNLYFMDYTDQLVLTGELNDVGSSIRTNVENSYRAGIELIWGWQLAKSVKWQANATYSQNKIEKFEEVIYDYTEDFEVIVNEYEDTDISYSPSVIAGSQLFFTPIKGMELGLFTKYVGEQYLDNTSNENRKIEAYLVNDVRLSYTLQDVLFKEVTFSLLVNNVLDEQYSSNGYTYSYIYGDMITENFYYPQAGMNFLAGLLLKF